MFLSMALLGQRFWWTSVILIKCLHIEFPSDDTQSISVSSVVSVSLSLPWAYILAVFTDLMNGSLSRVILILYFFKKKPYT